MSLRLQFVAATKVAATFLRKTLTPRLKENLFKEVSKNIGSASSGSRLWPKDRKDDKKNGIRIDWADKYQDAKTKKWFRNMVLQLNADAETPAIKDTVQKNGTHAKRVVAALPLNDDGSALDASFDEKALNTQFIDKLRDGV